MSGVHRAVAPSRTIADADWYGDDLTGVAHEKVLLERADLTETTGTGARFVDCVFQDSKVNCAVLVDAAFENCTFVRCSFFDAELTGCKFVGASFVDCGFDLLRVLGGDWSFCLLPSADLRRAQFTDVRMREVDLRGARAQGAVLVGCDLSAAAVSGLDVSGTDLRGSDISVFDPGTVTMAGAIIDSSQAAVVATAMGLDVRPGSAAAV